MFPIAVDFDGVLHSYVQPWTAHHVIPDPPVEGAIAWLNEICDSFPVTVFTTRACTPEGALAVAGWLRRYGFQATLHEITAIKPPALVLIDDRAWRFEGPGTFPSVEQIAAAKPWWAHRRREEEKDA